MGSNAKKKTTFAKLQRETRLRERRMDKQARKDARKNAANTQPDHTGGATRTPDPVHAIGPSTAEDAG
jgi:hypothetical protein